MQLDEIFDTTNRSLTRLRHSAVLASPAEQVAPAVAASLKSETYIEAFWPHVIAAIEADPDKLGTSFVTTIEGENRRVSVADIYTAYLADPAHAANPLLARRRGAVLASLALMSQLLNQSVQSWASDFDGNPPRCPHAFEIDIDEFVSLRMLLPRRGEQPGRVAANAPTLVMGGTATAITMCWNLLDQIPRCFAELHERDPESSEVEKIWADTRELIFRIGSGSLASFVSFASACSSSSSSRAS